jgi:flagellar hook-associated protein 1 FlgK
VNGIQSAGYGSNGSTGIDFFSGSTAGTIAVNPTLVADPSNVAASGVANQPGDGSQATKMAQLQETVPAGGTVTLQQQYSAMMVQLGAAAQQAQSNVQTGSMVLQQLSTQQASVSSVSLNEEAANLIQYQTAYNAAGRVISIINQSIDDMISQM